MILTRYGSIPNIGTFGKLELGSHTYYTVEQDWVDNKPFISCIPSGEYELVPHSSKKYGETYALVGESVSQYKSDLARYACLIHAANWPDNVQGCIGIGHLLTYINGKLGVTNSRQTVEEVKRYIGEGNTNLTIEWAEND